MGNALLCALQLVMRLAAHLHPAPVIDLHLLVIQHVLGPVTLGTQVDFLGAFAVLNAQLVVAATARAALAAKDTAGLVRWQIEGHRRCGVGQAAHHQWHVQVTIGEPHQHFHTDSGYQHRAVTIMRPATGDTQPAAGVLVVLPVTVPGQLHLDPTVFVAMDFTVGRPGNHRVLITADARARKFRQGWAENHIPWHGDKRVVITLT